MTASEVLEELDELGEDELGDDEAEEDSVSEADVDDELVSEAELDAELDDADEEAVLLEAAVHGILMLEAAPESSAHAKKPSSTAISRTTKYGMVRDAKERVPRWTPIGPAGGLSNSSRV
ncbi:MAG: hypothetical protein ABF780_09450 [Bifidobacterium aquikefiri]|uniref:hypothetical protein n=1 Tax=Bifidobacterium aquikefiri TaxID=1653207 RepID=UPI001FCF0F72|nr:hypothetical protein [Bifidobacterium aquikefiri]